MEKKTFGNIFAASPLLKQDDSSNPQYQRVWKCLWMPWDGGCYFGLMNVKKSGGNYDESARGYKYLWDGRPSGCAAIKRWSQLLRWWSNASRSNLLLQPKLISSRIYCILCPPWWTYSILARFKMMMMMMIRTWGGFSLWALMTWEDAEILTNL